MKKLFLILLTIFSISGIWSFGQDTAPSPIPTKLIAPNSPVWYYNALDSSLWIFKGQTGWLKMASNAQLQKYYWSKTQITNADTTRWGLNAGHDSLTIAAGSTSYFEVNYPQIFSGQKLIDTLGVMNTNIAGKEPLLTKGNLTAVSSKVTIGGTGTNALIGAGASVDVNEANIVHQNLSGHGINTHAQIDTHITNDGDLSSTNEIQDLSLSGNTLSLSGDATPVDLSTYARFVYKNGLRLDGDSVKFGDLLTEDTYLNANNKFLFLLNNDHGFSITPSKTSIFLNNDSTRMTAELDDTYLSIKNEFINAILGNRTSYNEMWKDTILVRSIKTPPYSTTTSFETLTTPDKIETFFYKNRGSILPVEVSRGTRQDSTGIKYVNIPSMYFNDSTLVPKYYVDSTIGLANYVKVSPLYAQTGNIWMTGYIKMSDLEIGDATAHGRIIGNNNVTYIQSFNPSTFEKRNFYFSGYGGENVNKMDFKSDTINFHGFVNSPSYKLNSIDLFSSLTNGNLGKWDGTKFVDGVNLTPQSLSGTTPSLNVLNGVNANLPISGNTTLTLSNLSSGTSGNIYLTNNASVYRIKIAGYELAPASNVTYDSTGILLPASSVYTHSSIGWYYNGTTVQIHKADYNLITY